jgi:short-subunit dehydrogenase
MTPFRQRYGPVAVVAGASEGLGAAFARALAARGLDLVLVARREGLLKELGERLTSLHGVSVRPVVCDLADAAFVDGIRDGVAGREVGLGVYNAAYAFVAPLLDRPLEDALRVVDVNVRGPLRFVHGLAPGMRARRRGGFILMSSLAGFQGAPKIGAYASSKAFNIVLGESLAAELRPEGIDVLVSCPGAIRTPNYSQTTKKDAPGTLDAQIVADRTLDALGRGALIVPGALNKFATFVMRRLLSRAVAVALMGKNTADLS